jgi:hypothetical protein
MEANGIAVGLVASSEKETVAGSVTDVRLALTDDELPEGALAVDNEVVVAAAVTLAALAVTWRA